MNRRLDFVKSLVEVAKDKLNSPLPHETHSLCLAIFNGTQIRGGNLSRPNWGLAVAWTLATSSPTELDALILDWPKFSDWFFTNVALHCSDLGTALTYCRDPSMACFQSSSHRTLDDAIEAARKWIKSIDGIKKSCLGCVVESYETGFYVRRVLKPRLWSEKVTMDLQQVRVKRVFPNDCAHLLRDVVIGMVATEEDCWEVTFVVGIKHIKVSVEWDFPNEIRWAVYPDANGLAATLMVRAFRERVENWCCGPCAAWMGFIERCNWARLPPCMMIDPRSVETDLQFHPNEMFHQGFRLGYNQCKKAIGCAATQ